MFNKGGEKVLKHLYIRAQGRATATKKNYQLRSQDLHLLQKKAMQDCYNSQMLITP